MSDADKTDAAGSSGIRASRRTVIKGVIASGVAVGAAGYIVYDRYGGGFHSFRCNALEVDFVKLGASFNPWGLIDDEAQALKCAAWSNSPAVGTCSDGWHPWLIVEHPA